MFREFRFTVLLIFIFNPTSGYAWSDYTKVSYLDFDGDGQDEIIINAKHGAGTGHYIEDIRIFRDEYPNLRLVFSARSLDSYTLEDLNSNYDLIGEISFSDPDKGGHRKIRLHQQKISFKDRAGKRQVMRKLDLGTKVYDWDGKNFALEPRFQDGI